MALDTSVCDGALPLTQSGHVHRYSVTLEYLALSNPRRKKILIKTRTPAYLHPLMLSSTYKRRCMLHNQTQRHPSCGKLMPLADASARHPDTPPVNLV